MTCVLQPCDAGIIKAFKSHYWKFFLQLVEAHLNEEKIYKVTIKDAMFLVATAWSFVSEIIIQNCWVKADIIDKIANQIYENSLEENYSTTLMEVSHLILNVSRDPIDAEQYIEIDALLDKDLDTNVEIVNQVLIKND